MAAEKTETEQLTYGSETRDNFELELDPKLYVKDKYFYRNRRIKIALYLLGGLLLMTAIVSLAIYLISGHRQRQNHWSTSVRRGSDAGLPPSTNNSSSLQTNETLSSPSTDFNQPTSIAPPATTSATSAPKIELQEDRRRFVRDMALEAWDAYDRAAFGHDALLPGGSGQYSRRRYGLNSGLTIVSSLSTLWLMNATEQFERGLSWVEEKLNLSAMEESVSVAKTVQHYLGSLLSTAALTVGRQPSFLLVKAVEVADLLGPAYNASLSGLPYEQLKLSTGTASGTTPTLAELGGQALEYSHLEEQLASEGEITRGKKYGDRARQIRHFFASKRKLKKPDDDGLYLKKVYIEVPGGQWLNTSVITLGKDGGAFYATLLKSYRRSGGQDREALTMFIEAIDALDQVGVFSQISARSGLLFAPDFYLKDHSLADFMTTDACYLGGLLALASHTLKNVRGLSSISAASDVPSNRNSFLEARRWASRIQRYWTLGEQLTATCHEAARRSPSRLPPHKFYFDNTAGGGGEEATNFRRNDGKDQRSYHLSAELAESYFLLWRLSREEKYREWAWELAQAIQAHCRVKGSSGFSGVEDVYALAADGTELPTTNYQNADLLAATLKYLYLTFDDSLPLDEWVFNQFGQPLPISKWKP